MAFSETHSPGFLSGPASNHGLLDARIPKVPHGGKPSAGMEMPPKVQRSSQIEVK